MELKIDSDHAIAMLLNEPHPEVVRALMARLKTIILPWGHDGCVPPKHVRKTGDGRVVGIVDPFLGEYGDAHHPEKYGWGWRAQLGSQLQYDVEKPTSAADVDAALLRAQNKVDSWLMQQAKFTIMDDPT